MIIRIQPATRSRWSDVVSAFGRSGSNPNSCWCQRFRDHNVGTNQDALRREVDHAEVPVGLLAYEHRSAARIQRMNRGPLAADSCLCNVFSRLPIRAMWSRTGDYQGAGDVVVFGAAGVAVGTPAEP